MSDPTAGEVAPANTFEECCPGPLPNAVEAFLIRTGAGGVTLAETLRGGLSNRTRRLHTATGRSYVIKERLPIIPGLFASEAAGLRALAEAGCLRVVQALAVAEDALVLEDLGGRERRSSYWGELGEGMAGLHEHTCRRFGWHADNYLGLVLQHNGWLEDGYEFFARRRILPYLSLRRCEQALAPEDRRDIERFCARLPVLVPPQPASLLHGDLVAGNVVPGPAGEPVLIDPAVHYGWAEAELAMTTLDGPFPDDFYNAYTAHRHLESGWRERFEVYLVAEDLYMVSQLGGGSGRVERVRSRLRRLG